MLGRESSNDLAAYVVWVPELGAKVQNVADGMALVTDKRARQYWDPEELLGGDYQRILPTPGPAWDVYLLYPRGVQWTAAAPAKPAFWMHQLGGVTNAPRLDSEVFRQHVERSLRA